MGKCHKERTCKMDNLLSEMLNWDYKYEDTDKINKFLGNAKNYYQEELSSANLDDDDLIYFSWAKQPLHFYLIRTSGRLNFNQFLVMASKEKNLSKNEITYIDKLKETDNAQFKHSNEQEQVNSILGKADMLERVNSKDIIKNSIFTLSISMNTQIWINQWFGKELNHTKQHFSVAPIKLKYNELGLHSQKFKLEEINHVVNDPQFTRELEECMTVFEHEYYYPAAAGLGGVMESLLYKTLENYKRASNRVLGSDPTLLDYLGALKKFDLIDRRQSNRIRSAFTIRNSISHYNPGFTEVSDIQTILHGIENIYTTLYLPSLKWKEAHPNQQLPEPSRQNQ